MITRRTLLAGLACGSLGVLSSPSVAHAQEPKTMATMGFRVPDEADPHERTFMQWPVNKRVHSDPVFLDMLQQSVADVANTIADFEPVVMLMAQPFENMARRKLSTSVEIWHIPTDDLWCRDSGPLFVKNDQGELAVRSLNFNGWGNKQVHENDGKVASRVAERLGFQLLNNGLVGEAGGVESDGEGTLIAHESSWVNANRNTGGKKEIEALLLEAYGAQKMIWAPGIAGQDITDYHIDALARFVAPGHLVLQTSDEPDLSDPWAAAALETRDILEKAQDAQGRSFRITIIEDPVDTRVTRDDFVAAYVNYYVCNGAVVCAEFGDRDADQKAVEKLSSLYPDRDVITLNVDPIGEIGGGIHCATQQQPKV